MQKLRIKRIFAFIFIAISFINVIVSLLFIHADTLIENIFHYVESAVHLVLLVFLCKHAIKNKIGHFFHEYFMEAIIMGVMSSVGLIFGFILNPNKFEDGFINLLPVTLSLFVNIFLYFSFEHHHDNTVKVVTIILTTFLLIISVNASLTQILEMITNNDFSAHAITTLLPNILTSLFNIFVILTFLSMKHVIIKNDEETEKVA